MKTFKILTTVFFLLALMSGNVKGQWSANRATSFESGSGSELDPWIIKTPGQLAYLAWQVNQTANYSNGRYFKLAQNISLSGNNWDLPIGNSATRTFQGTFDGAGFVISYLRMERVLSDDGSYWGLFGRTNGATIQNLTMENVTLYDYRFGTLIGLAERTTIMDCKVINNNFQLRGIQVAGFIYDVRESTIERCSFSGSVFSTGSDNTTIGAGGFAGMVRSSTIINCSSEGSVGSGYDAGGFINSIESGNTTTIQNCNFTGTTAGSMNVGGFIGKVSYADVDITNCWSSGTVIGQAGIIGVSTNVGGFIGIFNNGQGKISGCRAETSITGINTTSGGFIGRCSSSTGVTTISDCRSTGSVESLTTYVGGFVGDCGNNVSFDRCYAVGAVTGRSHVGGFVGNLTGGNVSDCYAAGAVKADESVGGFGGSLTGGNVSNCYTVGTVEGNSIVGGFGGSISNVKVTSCFAAGAIFGKNWIGGFVGSSYTATYENCYFDTQTTNVSSASSAGKVDGIEGKPTSELTNGINPGFSKTDTKNDNWNFSLGYYPQLLALLKSKDATTRLRSALSVVPLKLANDKETVGAVKTFFQLAEKMPSDVAIKTGVAITWVAYPPEKMTIVNHVLYAKASDDPNEWYTLTLRAGDAERSVQFRPANNLMTADILELRINGVPKPFDNNKLEYTHTIDCKSNDESVYLEIILGGFTDCKTTALPIDANQQRTITVKTDDDEKDYIFKVKKPLPSDIFVQRWNDVLAVNNNIYTNGGHNFTGYKWFKGGTEITDARGKGYIQEKGGLTGIYTATLTSQKGTFETCKAEITKMKSMVAVYPNPVQRGQTVRVETSPTPALPQREGEVPPSGGLRGATLFDTAGNIISKQTLHDPVAEIAMPDMQGTYMLQLTINGVSETFKIVVE